MRGPAGGGACNKSDRQMQSAAQDGWHDTTRRLRSPSHETEMKPMECLQGHVCPQWPILCAVKFREAWRPWNYNLATLSLRWIHDWKRFNVLWALAQGLRIEKLEQLLASSDGTPRSHSQGSTRMEKQISELQAQVHQPPPQSNNAPRPACHVRRTAASARVTVACPRGGRLIQPGACASARSGEAFRHSGAAPPGVAPQPRLSNFSRIMRPSNLWGCTGPSNGRAQSATRDIL